MKRLILAAFVVLVLGFTTLVRANPLPLQNNGNNLIYDPNLNITWYDPVIVPTGMTWSAAVAWASILTVGGTTTGSWSLPTTLPVDGATYNYNETYNGATDVGFNISASGSAYPGSTGSEMAYLFYVELGGTGYYDVNGGYQSDYGFVNKGPFVNLQPTAYWSGSVYAPDSTMAWYFYFNYGYQGPVAAGDETLALAVHSGDVLGNGVVLPDGPSTPIPGALLLFAPGLAGIVALKRRMGRRG